MSMWRRTRGEVAGVYRSMHYDLVRRSGGPDATDRPPSRVLAVTTFGVLAVLGATGSYLTVVNGLGVLLGEPDTAGPYPLAATAPRGGAGANSGLGDGTARTEPNGVPPGTSAPVSPAPAPAPGTGGGGESVPTTAPAPPTPSPTPAPAPSPSPPGCDCPPPPVPTPTDPDIDSPEPSASPSPSPGDSPSESPSASPSPAEPAPPSLFPAWPPYSLFPQIRRSSQL